jgi:hypothetical protein
MKRILGAILTCFFISSVVTAQQDATAPKLVDCTAINQAFLDDPRGARYFFLDLPSGATFTSGQFEARGAAGGAWMVCGPFNYGSESPPTSNFFSSSASKAPKLRTDLPFLSSVTPCQTISFGTYFVPDDSDKTSHYQVDVTANNPGGPFGELYVRLVLNYKMRGPSCVAQQTYFVAKGGSVVQLSDLRIPAGKTITSETLFGRINPPAPPGANSQWVDCGTNQGNFPTGRSNYNGCLSQLGVGMYTNPLLNDPLDQAPGRMSACGANGWGGYGYCRVRFSYTP